MCACFACWLRAYVNQMSRQALAVHTQPGKPPHEHTTSRGCLPKYLRGARGACLSPCTHTRNEQVKHARTLILVCWGWVTESELPRLHPTPAYKDEGVRLLRLLAAFVCAMDEHASTGSLHTEEGLLA